MELFRALGVLAESPGEEHRRLGQLLGIGGAPDPAVHTELFTLNLYPYASVYLGAEGMLGGEARDRVAGFWRAIGLTPPAEPDHLSVLLSLYAGLAEVEAAETDEAQRLLRRQSRKSLLWEHLVPWVFPYLDKMEELEPPFYSRWGSILTEALLEELRLLGAGDDLPLHLREAPSLPDPREAGGADFLDALIAPVRSGLILTRADLARGAHELSLGLRMGERRYILKAFFAQEPGATLRWLAEEARRNEARHAARDDELSSVAGFWASRARGAAELLESLRATDATEFAGATDGAAHTSSTGGAQWSHGTDAR